jgi:serine/threonine-protein kinase
VKIYAVEEMRAYYCIRCGKEIDETADDLALCSQCRVNQEKAKKPLMEKINCSSCGTDLTSMANEDGKAEELKDVVFYLCKKCAGKEKGKLSPETPKSIDHYVILKELGRGGMGVVYKAWDERTGRVVALKMMLPFLIPHKRAKKRFLREMKISSLAVHPNLVRYIDGKASGTQVYFTMEFVKDGSLWDMFEKNNHSPLPVKFVCELMVQALDGLDYLHSHPQKFIHRNLKPQNILLRKENDRYIAKISDFGLAESAVRGGISEFSEIPDPEEPAEVPGTPFFMSPQQFIRFKYPEPHFDTYSMGVTLYLLLAGDYHFNVPQRTGITGMIRAILMGLPIDAISIILDEKQKPVPVREKNPSIPERLARVIDKSVQKEPEKRFQSAREFKEALIKAMEG